MLPARCAVLILALLPGPAAAAGLKFTFDEDPGSWQLWFNATRDHCNSYDTPDASMAAFRGSDGTVVAFIGDDDRAGGAPRQPYRRLLPLVWLLGGQPDTRLLCPNPQVRGGQQRAGRLPAQRLADGDVD